jgi:hypothetical protein
MNSKKIAKYFSLAFTILLADVVKELVLHKIGWRKDFHHPYKSTLVGMAITVMVYYPVFTFLDYLVGEAVNYYLSKTKKTAGGGFVGLAVALGIGVCILFVIYLKIWFKINILPFKY